MASSRGDSVGGAAEASAPTREDPAFAEDPAREDPAFAEDPAREDPAFGVDPAREDPAFGPSVGCGCHTLHWARRVSSC